MHINPHQLGRQYLFVSSLAKSQIVIFVVFIRVFPSQDILYVLWKILCWSFNDNYSLESGQIKMINRVRAVYSVVVIRQLNLLVIAGGSSDFSGG